MNLYALFILGVNIKYIPFSILYRHINVPMGFKEFNVQWGNLECVEAVLWSFQYTKPDSLLRCNTVMLDWRQL